MTYDNAMKAMTVAAAVPAIASSAGVVGAGIAAGSGLQVASGLATGLSAAATIAPSLKPAAHAANTYQRFHGSDRLWQSRNPR